MSADKRLPLDKDKLKKKFDVSHFDINAIIRGIQLTLVGGENPIQFIHSLVATKYLVVVTAT
jgi:hypothetical protein